MRLLNLLILTFTLTGSDARVFKRDTFADGQPIELSTGKGGPIDGGTNFELDKQNPDGLGRQSTDSGIVPNMKWSFSLSKARLFNGGWLRTQVSTDLPSSTDISGVQQHLKKGAIREMHWHRVSEWGFVYKGSILVSAVDEKGEYQVDRLGFGDIWYFPKGQAHVLQGLEDENEFLLAFDDANFDAFGITFEIEDWVTHTPKSVLAKNFGVSESLFDNVPKEDEFVLNGTVSSINVTAPASNPVLSGNSSFVYHTFTHPAESVPGGGGSFYKIDSTNFPVAKTIASTFVTLKPGGLREMHWHPNAQEWLYFHRGQGRATVYIGNGRARTFDLQAGDTAVFPDNAGHYIENTSKTEDLVWIELYKSDRVADVSLTQWLALTPPDIAARVLRVPVSFIESLKKEKQLLLPK